MHHTTWATVRINEVVASNASVSADENGDFSDWIELVNIGPDAVNLAGFGLSDDLDAPFRWVFPDLELDPGHFLLVWASGKDRSNNIHALHTNFSIASGGEAIQLTRADGAVLDVFEARSLPANISAGRQPDGVGPWLYFDAPTPGASNDTTGYTEILAPPSFSHEGGFFDGPFALSISSPDPGTEIHYSLDGSLPSPHNVDGTSYVYKQQYQHDPGQPFGTFLQTSYQSHPYTEPIPIQNRQTEPDYFTQFATTYHHEPFYLPESPVFKGTTVRAIATRPDALPSRVITHTYFVAPDSANRYSLPVIALTIQEDHLFDYSKGLHVAGVDFDQWRFQFPDRDIVPSAGANYRRRGEEWPLHLEVFLPGQGRVLAQNAGWRIHGGATRTYPQKSFRLYARNQYDDINSFDLPFFPGLKNRVDGSPITSFRRLTLRNSGQDAAKDPRIHTGESGTRIRDAFLQRLMEPLDLDRQAYEPAVLFLNGEYWGMINIRERYDAHYIASHYQIDEDDVAILSLDNILEAGAPTDRRALRELREYMDENDLNLDEHFAYVKERLDIQNFIYYYMAQIFIGNYDWPGNNIRYWRKRTPVSGPGAPAGHDGRWRFLVYDLDFGCRRLHNNTLAHATSPTQQTWSNAEWSTIMLRNLLENEQFQTRFINAFADHMNTSFKPNVVDEIIDSYYGRILPYFPEHIHRWPYTGDTSPEFMKDFFVERPAVMQDHLIEYFDLQGTVDFTVNVPKPHKGRVRINTVVLDTDTPGMPDPAQPFPWTGTYFEGVPISLKAKAREGYGFAGWLEFPEVESPTLAIDPAAIQEVTALFEKLPARYLLHYWHFNDADSLLQSSYSIADATLDIETGASTEITYGDGQLFTGENARLQQNAGTHLRLNAPLGASLVFHIPTTGYEAIVLRYETRRSGQGAAIQEISYTVDGLNFLPFTEFQVFNSAPQLRELDFSDTEFASNNPLFGIRITFVEAEGGDNGNNRFDNFTVEGRAIEGTNIPPQVLEYPTFQRAIEDGEALGFDLNEIFTDPNLDALSFHVDVERPAVVQASITDEQLLLLPSLRGDTGITLHASDGVNPPAVVHFRVLVYPSAHAFELGPFLFDAWSSGAAQGAYPENMLFLQSDLSDPGLDAPLDYAYFIPEDEYHPDDAATIAFPYNNTRRTRINGLGSDGISFLNTGQDRDLGGALLALNTFNQSNLTVSWIGATPTPNERIYGIRLQYRTSIHEPFLDVMDGTLPVEYHRSESSDALHIGPVPLPHTLSNKKYVQLLWRYYHIAGDSGPRAELRLDDIVVTADAVFEGEDSANPPEGEAAPDGEINGGIPNEHSADQNGDAIISLSELLRVIQFFNTGGLHCATPPTTSEDGYLPGPNAAAQDCIPHASDYNPQDWVISLSELLRLIQFFNTGGYFPCPELNTEDGYCVGAP